MALRYEIDPHEAVGYIYGLHDGDGVIRYVGKTTRLKARMTEHVIHSRKADGAHNDELFAWILSIDVLYVRLLEKNVPESQLNEAERKWIVNIGLPNLFNRTPGGTSSQTGADHYWYGRHHSDETRSKMGLSGELHPAYGKRSPKKKFTVEQEAVIASRIRRGETRKAVARELGVHPSTIERLVRER